MRLPHLNCMDVLFGLVGKQYLLTEEHTKKLFFGNRLVQQIKKVCRRYSIYCMIIIGSEDIKPCRISQLVQYVPVPQSVCSIFHLL